MNWRLFGMKRRTVITALGALPSAALCAKSGMRMESPYAEVDWERVDFVHSMSHQHQGQTDASRKVFEDMGYRHFAFSNYYPSAPTYPLPESYREAHPEVIAAPNAEHHSFTDTGLHANALGSLLATGYGESVKSSVWGAPPIEHRFERLEVYRPEQPWLGVYRLDLRFTGQGEARLSLDGAVECQARDGFAERGSVMERVLPVGNHTLYVRTQEPTMALKLAFDPKAITVTQLRLMQGTNRPWRRVFDEAFEKLLVPDGGGITLNHPTGQLKDYLPMLDFDPQVLGIEVWNQLTSGFGSSRGFYDLNQGPHLHFYQLWDAILRTGRRCWGFFVKDHNTFGRGRNVLLLADETGATAAEREAAALRAYRKGAFFGSVAALAANSEGAVITPYDRSEFRFSQIKLEGDTLHVAVQGHDLAKRPQVQIRFVTEAGVASYVDGAEAAFPLRRDATGKLEVSFVRVEAFAYPRTHQQGSPLTSEMMRSMNVHEISQIHDQKVSRGAAFAGADPALRVPIPLVDMIFSQPLRRV
jgi:hypothetical protein